MALQASRISVAILFRGLDLQYDISEFFISVYSVTREVPGLLSRDSWDIEPGN